MTKKWNDQKLFLKIFEDENIVQLSNYEFTKE